MQNSQFLSTDLKEEQNINLTGLTLSAAPVDFCVSNWKFFVQLVWISAALVGGVFCSSGGWSLLESAALSQSPVTAASDGKDGGDCL